MSLREKFHNHPAVVLGRWLKEKRREKNWLSPQLTSFIDFNLSKYSQIELGIGDWVDEHFLEAFALALELSNEDKELMNQMYIEYVESDILQMTDLFTRDEMRPAFPPTRNWTLEKEEALLDAVFKPLE